jgi:NAD(P)-dependent dehydrogenase (short-subunit alcohol dehydrogenase family)
MNSTMNPRTIVITGGSDGVGAAAARELKARGETVVIIGRSPDTTASVARELDVPFHVADFADLAQVRALAADLNAAYPRIDVLANNAGGIMGRRTVTRDGFEQTFQVNHLAGFLLTHLLLPTLIASGAAIIQTASAAAKAYGDIDINDLQLEKNYTPLKAYGNSKLANILFTRELQRRFADQGISAAAFHPGVVATNFASDSTRFMRYVYHTPVIKRLYTISPAKGAEQLVWLARGTPGSDWQPGEYYEKHKIAKSAPTAHDDELAWRLWEESVRMLHMPA